jgi:hypothetical protein
MRICNGGRALGNSHCDRGVCAVLRVHSVTRATDAVITQVLLHPIIEQRGVTFPGECCALWAKGSSTDHCQSERQGCVRPTPKVCHKWSTRACALWRQAALHTNQRLKETQQQRESARAAASTSKTLQVHMMRHSAAAAPLPLLLLHCRVRASPAPCTQCAGRTAHSARLALRAAASGTACRARAMCVFARWSLLPRAHEPRSF